MDFAVPRIVQVCEPQWRKGDSDKRYEDYDNDIMAAVEEEEEEEFVKTSDDDDYDDKEAMSDEEEAVSVSSSLLGYQSSHSQPEVSNDVVDIPRIIELLEESKNAGDLIAGKDVMPLIGLTGAGKTTTTLYLAGAKFEEEDVEGFSHYNPRELPNASLFQFAVSGGGKSVTKTIRATSVHVEMDDGRIEDITICDTPGFGDTKGSEMDISNGLGMVHALKRAATIKPVLVLDFSTMAGARWLPLRKNLSTVIAMMGRRHPDFSAFSYIFTRCEGKNYKKVATRLAGFQQSLRADPKDILGGKDEDFPILDALLSDMIVKTQPADVVCIDPEDTDNAPAILKKLWSGHRLNSPESAFVNFCSQESMNAMLVQTRTSLCRIEKMLENEDFGNVEMILQQLIGLADALSLREINDAVIEGREKVQRYLSQIHSSVDTIVGQTCAEGISMDEFENLMISLLSKMALLMKTEWMHTVCGIPFDVAIFRGATIAKVLSLISNPVEQAKAAGGADVPDKDILQKALLRFSSIADAFYGLPDCTNIETKCLDLLKTVADIINPILSRVQTVLETPKSDNLRACLAEIEFLLEMNDFLNSGRVSFMNAADAQWACFADCVKQILENLSEKRLNCDKDLGDLISTLKRLLERREQWTLDDPTLPEGDVLLENRRFLLVQSSSSILCASLNRGSFSTPKQLVESFDRTTSTYLACLAGFMKSKVQGILDDTSRDASGRYKEAAIMLEKAKVACSTCTVLRDVDRLAIPNAEKELAIVQGKLKTFIEESQKNHGHGIRRPKELKPSRGEIERARANCTLRQLLIWYARCMELRAYKIKTGHCRVPRKHPRLGEWVGEQRKEKKKYEQGLKTTMTDEKLEHLAELNFVWDMHAEKWNERMEELKQFKARHGHCRVPQKTPGSKLGTWVDHQKTYFYAMRAGKTRVGNYSIDTKRMAELEAFGLFDHLN